MNDPAAVPTGYGLYLLQTLLALGVVCLLAFVLLRWGAKWLYGAGRSGQRMRLVERLPLEPRRALYLVEVAGRRLVLGSSENGVTLLVELEPETVEKEASPTKTNEDPSPES